MKEKQLHRTLDNLMEAILALEERVAEIEQQISEMD